MPNSIINSQGSSYPTVASDLAPAVSGEYRWFNTTNGWSYEVVGGEWVVVGGGMNFTHDGSKMEITKLTIENGMVTELEFIT